MIYLVLCLAWLAGYALVISLMAAALFWLACWKNSRNIRKRESRELVKEVWRRIDSENGSGDGPDAL